MATPAAGRSEAPEQHTVSLGPDAFTAIGGIDDPPQVEIPRRDLFRHVLVAGTTGSGKTTRVVEILNGLEDDALCVVVFETAKRTYRRRVHRAGRDAPLVYTLGGGGEHPHSRVRPLRVNPFFFELGTSLKKHIAVLSDALAELMPTEAMIGPLMRRAVEAAYTERGWDIERGCPVPEAGLPTWPTVIDFVAQVRTLANTLNYGPEVQANYRGALENRAALFVDAAFQDIFSHGGNLPIDELMPPGRDVIVEVENLPPSEVDVRAFVMTLLLSRLRTTQAVRHSRHRDSVAEDAVPESPFGHRGDNTHREPPDAGSRRGVSGDQIREEQRRWLVVIEEAHNVLDRSFEERRPVDESNAGRTLLRCIDRLLQEGREIEIGLMVVDQSPARLARTVISNTGTKVVLRLEDGAEMEEIGRALGLERDAWQKLGFLQEGEAIVKASYMDTPVKTARLAQLSAGPGDALPWDDEGWIPSYIDLEKIWKPVLDGVQPPDDTWCERLLTSSRGDTELAGFVGLKVHLFAFRDDPQAAVRTQDLRAALAGPVDAAKLVAAARSAYRSSVAPRNEAALLDVERLVFRALAAAPSPERPGAIPDVDLGIQRASDLLEMEGLGTAKTWRALLVRLAAGQARSWSAAVQDFRTYARDTGRGDPTTCLQYLLLCRADLTAEASVFEPVDPTPKVRAMVSPVLERRADDALDQETESRWAVLRDHLHRQLCHWYLARQRGRDAATEL